MVKRCKHCKSNLIEFHKILGYDFSREQKMFLYMVKCLACKKVVHIARNPENYAFFKRYVPKWDKSKSYLAYERKLTENTLI